MIWISKEVDDPIPEETVCSSWDITLLNSVDELTSPDDVTSSDNETSSEIETLESSAAASALIPSADDVSVLIGLVLLGWSVVDELLDWSAFRGLLSSEDLSLLDLRELFWWSDPVEVNDRTEAREHRVGLLALELIRFDDEEDDEDGLGEVCEDGLGEVDVEDGLGEAGGEDGLVVFVSVEEEEEEGLSSDELFGLTRAVGVVLFKELTAGVW